MSTNIVKIKIKNKGELNIKEESLKRISVDSIRRMPVHNTTPTDDSLLSKKIPKNVKIKIKNKRELNIKGETNLKIISADSIRRMPVQYTESVRERECKYASTLPYEEFFKCFPRELKSSEHGNPSTLKNPEYFKLVQNYLQLMIENNYELEIKYHPSEKNLDGRIFSKSPVSLQRIHNSLRVFLSEGLYRDYDMKNAHPTIFMKICEDEGLPIVHQKNYVENRAKVLKENDTDKRTLLVKLNSDNARGHGTWNPDLKGLINEWNTNKKFIYKKYKDKFLQENLNNPISSVVNKLMCIKENEILQRAMPNSKYLVPMFDGFMTDETVDLNNLPSDICQWDEKPIKSDIKVPDDFQFVPKKNTGKTYEELKEEFEKNHAKIINKSKFICFSDTEYDFKSRTDLITSYEHLQHEKWVEHKSGGYIKRCSFILDWLQDPEMKVFKDIKCCPVAEKCPPDMFNTWIPFAFMFLKPSLPNDKHIETFKKHVLILCDNDLEQQKIILQWIAHMIQYPDEKSFCPVFISEEGCGKGTLLKILARLFGQKKMLETANAIEDVFGQFNDPMIDAFLVNINECEKQDMNKVDSRMKGLVTDGFGLWVNGKGIKRFNQESYHRFIIFTNQEDPIKVKEKGRRYHVLRSSDELCGDNEYFTEMNRLIKCDEFIYSISLYLLNLPDVPEVFNVKEFPISEHQKVLQKANRDYIEMFIEDLAGKNRNLKELLFTSVEFYEKWQEFLSENNIECNYTKPTFEKKISLNKKLAPTISVKPTKRCNLKKIDIPALITMFNIGCLIPE